MAFGPPPPTSFPILPKFGVSHASSVATLSSPILYFTNMHTKSASITSLTTKLNITTLAYLHLYAHALGSTGPPNVKDLPMIMTAAKEGVIIPGTTSLVIMETSELFIFSGDWINSLAYLISDL